MQKKKLSKNYIEGLCRKKTKSKSGAIHFKIIKTDMRKNQLALNLGKKDLVTDKNSPMMRYGNHVANLQKKKFFLYFTHK